MSTNLLWEYVPVCNPFVDKLKKMSKDMILFDGHFYLEDGAMPVYRICSFREHTLLVKILEKKTLENTSQYVPSSSTDTDTTNPSDDSEDFGQICLFPSAIIELKIKILRVLKYGDEEFKKISKLIQDAEKEVIEKSEILRVEREKRELEEARKHFEIKKEDPK